jgi:hypothetical protein
MALNYQASGRLLASTPLIGTHLDLILVCLTPEGSPHNKYVVSKYVEGQAEWTNGHYYTEYREAYAYYISELFLTLPASTMDIHPKLHAEVSKCSGFLDRIAKDKAKKTKVKVAK